ncbi:hypothetical protein CTAYLR_000733 [Chrysophaeum taylorii]|uniref:PH domain-containing protein n=1 Tax=Chrysophaeum taylorii TaxID=2483200 RepID=A0AAD7U9F3_9STRA|nr:hypothetical protein CTAYLR_000733 [Chrysophaeum taylorii]
MSGWVRRKVKNSDKWVRRWLELNQNVLHSYQANPAEAREARVMNMLDLRKTREIKLMQDGTFNIIPETTDPHPGYLMKAETPAEAEAWVDALNAARLAVLDPIPVPQVSYCCFCIPISKVPTEDKRALLR